MGGLRLWRQHFEIFRPDLGDVARDAFFVGVGTRAELSFNEEFVAFVDISFCHLGKSSPELDSVTFGSFRHHGSSRQGVGGGGSGERGRSGADTAVDVADFRVGSHVANEHDFVQGHGVKVLGVFYE